MKGSTAISYKDLMMLKIILSSGLYPHIAIADEFNSSKVNIIIIDIDLLKTIISIEICLVIPVFVDLLI